MITAIDKNTALVLIDLQKGIVKRELAHPIADILTNTALLVTAFRTVNLPVVIVNVNPFGSKLSSARVEVSATPHSRIIQKVSTMAITVNGFIDIVPEIISSKNDIFITKHTWNAFYDTNLHNSLQENGITGIVLAGVSTSIGVEGTARAASELGYNLTFATDAMTDRSLEAHERSMKHIFPRIGELGTTSRIIEELFNSRAK